MCYKRKNLKPYSLLSATLLACAALCCSSTAVHSAVDPNVISVQLSRDEKLNLLKARQAELELEKAEAEMERAELELSDTQALAQDNIVTINELRKAQQTYKEATINHEQAKNRLEQTRLEFLKNATLIRVINAKIFRGEDGEVMAAVELKNDSDIRKARVVMGATVSEKDLAALLKVDNIIVTLRGRSYISSAEDRLVASDEAIIGDPFYTIVSELKLGRTESLEFRMLKKGVEQITVELKYLETTKEYDVFLQKEALQDLPTITSAQINQHGDLGTTIRYNLQLERLAKTDQSFALCALNWPEEIHFDFVDPKSKARMASLKFSGEETIRGVNFEVRIPKKLDPALIDASIGFYVVVARQEQLPAIAKLKKKFAPKPIPPEEISKIRGNYVELELIPKGIGELAILVSNLYQEVQQHQPVQLKFSVINSGTIAVTRVTPEIDLPLEWEGELRPVDVAIIDPGQKVLFTADLQPPVDVSVGEYLVKVETEGYCGVEIIEADDKDFTVKIAPESNITGTVLLVGLLVLLVLGIAIASVKISRR